jgi:hypothetical protein
MLFDLQENTIESEKERNFYFKFFAGYYFNELVPGIENRVQDFCQILNNAPDRFNDCDFSIELSPGNTHVTFDLHTYLFSNSTDRGESADIFIYDQAKDICISIEAKWLEDWDYDKDILANNKRIQILTKRFNKVYQCLLIKKSKLKNGKKKATHSGSNFSKLNQQKEIPIILITWEDLLAHTTDPRVKEFFSYFITMHKAEFRMGLTKLTD